MILKIGQKVWAPKVAGVPAHKPENNVYELVGAVDEEEGSHEGYELKHDGHIFYAQAGTIRHLEEVNVCKQCGSDKIQFPMWVDNLQVVHDACEGLDPFCPECQTTLTRSFHCTLDEYLKLDTEEDEPTPLDKDGNPMSLEELWDKKHEIDWKNMSFEEWEERCSADVDAKFWHSEIYTHRCYENMKAGFDVKLPGNPTPGSKFYVKGK